MMNVMSFTQHGHPMLGFVHEGFITFSAVQANEVLKHAVFEWQRKISEDHVRVLADIMSRGSWEPKDKVDFAALGDDLILVNGYHRMRAQVACGRPVEWTVVIHRCISMGEVRSLYHKFDTNTRIRQAPQILAGCGFSEGHNLPKNIASALYNAVPIIAANFSKLVKDRDILTSRVVERRIEMATEYARAASMYDQCLKGCAVKLKGKFLVAGTAAVALVTLRYQPIKANEFWRGAAENNGLLRGDPRLTLHNDLLSRARNAGSAVQAFASPAYAWNAWFDDREIKVIKIYKEQTRAFLSGTPFEE